MLVFDIETVPFKSDTYSETQLEYIQKKLTLNLSRDSKLDPTKEENTIKGTDPYLAAIVCIGLYYPKTGERIALINESERSILESFWTQIAQFNGIFISFNGIKFDVPFIIKRSIVHGLVPTNTSFLTYTKYNPYPPHFDVYLQLGGRERSISLKQACDMYTVPSPKNGSVSAETVADAFYAGRIQEIAEYCIRDLESTYLLYKKLRPFIA